MKAVAKFCQFLSRIEKLCSSGNTPCSTSVLNSQYGGNDLSDVGVLFHNLGRKRSNKPITSCNTSDCPSVYGPAPIPIVIIDRSSLMIFASCAGMASSVM